MHTESIAISSFTPFNLLTKTQLQRVDSAVDIEFFSSNQRLIKSHQVSEFLWVVIKGQVDEYAEGVLENIYRKGDHFDAIQLFQNTPTHDFKATEDSLCYCIPRHVFLELCEENVRFASFFTASINKKRDLLLEQNAIKSSSNLLMSSIETVPLRSGFTLLENSTLRQAAQSMTELNVTALLIRAKKTIGIITNTDLQKAIAHPSTQLNDEAVLFAHFPIIKLPQHALLFEAQQKMMERQIGHIAIENEWGLIGILDERTVLKFFANNMSLYANRIESSTDLSELKDVSDSINTLLEVLNEQGTHMSHMMKLMTQLKDQLLARLWSLWMPANLQNKAALIVMGSEGRGEQLINTDQDNALIFTDDVDSKDVKIFTQRFNDALLSLGYPPCPGNMMLTNPLWCKNMSAYKDSLFEWIMKPSAEGHMYLSVFTDAHCIAGEPLLLNELHTYLRSKIQTNAMFLMHFAKPMMQFETPLGLFATFHTEDGEHKDELDLKKGGIFPIVHGARSLALEFGIEKHNTIERLKALKHQRVLDSEFLDEVIEAFEFLCQLRLNSMIEHKRQHKALDNHVNPKSLSKLERDILKDSFRTVHQFKKHLKQHFRLDGVL